MTETPLLNLPKKGRFYLVREDLNGYQMDMGEHKDEIMLHKAQLVRITDPITINGWTGVKVPKNLIHWTQVDVPTEKLTQLNLKTILTLVIPTAIANIHIGRRKV